MATATMPAPATNPADRDPATVASPATYVRRAAVWIFRGGAWRPGIVLASSEGAALVEYRYAGNLATGTDTAIARDLAARDEYDPHLDPTPLPPVEGVDRPRDEPTTDQ
jgi:hypothetical protein